VVAASFTGQSVLADTYGNRNKGFFESLFGAPRHKKPRRTILPWWKNDDGANFFYGGGYGDENYNDPEPVPGKGMGNLTYIPPKLVPLADSAFSKLYAPDTQSQAILAELSASKPAIRVPQIERRPILDLYWNAGFKPLWL